MNRVIVTGATGFIGSAFIKFLLNQKVDVLALGRKDLNQTPFGGKITQSKYFNYLKIELREINTLPDKLKEMNWSSDNSTVFYHFAWKGRERLTDGDVNDQIENVEFSAKAVIAAKSIGCKKFINVGSQEEKLAEKYLETKKWKTEPYQSNMGRYAISKLASKDMCSLVSYLNKIDYIHIRFSVIVDENDLNTGYISSVFRTILDGDTFEEPQNTQLFDIISVNDAVQAFYLIGENGQNKDEFFIGSGEPKTLKQYFTEFSLLFGEGKYVKTGDQEQNQLLNKDDFANDYLFRVTGFKPDANIHYRILNCNK